VVAFLARSGTGKSTVAYALLGRLSLWGDDAVCLATSERGMESIPLPFDLLLAHHCIVFDSVSDSVPSFTDHGEDTEPVRLGAVCVLRADAARP